MGRAKINDGLTRSQRYAQKHPEKRKATHKAAYEKRVASGKIRAYGRKNLAKNAEAQARYRAKHPERSKEQLARYRASLPPDYFVEYRKKNAEKIYLKGAEYRYGITPEQYESMRVSQNDKCAICGVDFSEFSSRPAIDHNHETGIVRALLCAPCNFKVEVVEGEAPWRDSVLRYLAVHRK